MAPTTQSVMLMKIVHRTHGNVEVIAGVQHIDSQWTPAGQTLGGGLDPCDPCGIDTYERHEQANELTNSTDHNSSWRKQ